MTDFKKMHGGISTEYLLICATLALALGIGMASEDSVLLQLLDAFKTAYAKIAHAISLP